jgi:uncharacterized protein
VRTPSIRLCAALLLSWCAAGARSQSTDSPATQNITTLEAQAAKSDAIAQFNRGVGYDLGRGAKQDHAKAAVWYRKAAEQGFAKAQCHLGLLYRDGQGVQRDYFEAAAWFRKAATQGDPEAQFFLGLLYTFGHGVPKDYNQAASWDRKAAEQGLPQAETRLGHLYEDGFGVPQDYAQAVLWMSKAAEQGIIDSQRELGELYDSGGLLKVVPDGTGTWISVDGEFEDESRKNHAEAALWWRKAAEQGDSTSQYDLGSLYNTGSGVPQNFAEAYFWLSIAASGTPMMGDKVVVEARDEAASQLTKTVLLQTQERARKWLETHPVNATAQ